MQPGKIKQIYKILGLFKKSVGFEKSWCFSKKHADLRNLGAFQKSGGFEKSWCFSKIRRIWEILALFKKSGGFTKYWRFTEKQADDRILAGVKILATGEKAAGLEKTGGPLTVLARRNLQLLTSSWTGWRALVQILVDMLPLSHADPKWGDGSGCPAFIGGRVNFH
jgi:hypothetical protein